MDSLLGKIQDKLSNEMNVYLEKKLIKLILILIVLLFLFILLIAATNPFSENASSEVIPIPEVEN
jgi:hypothetical protein